MLRELHPQYHVKGPKRFAESIKFIRDKLGITPFTPGELMSISHRYQQDLINGISKGADSSLAMYDTRLPSVDREKLPVGKKVLVIEIGGTNIRAASVINSEQGLEIEKKEGEELFIKKGLKRKVYSDADDFLNEVFNFLDPVISKVHPDTLSVIWSFPGEPQISEDGISVDIKSTEELTKGFVIPGISMIPIGKKILGLLNNRYQLKENIPLAVMNDTRAAEGGIIGSGFNLAFGKYNSESGGFDKISDFIPYAYRQVDEMSANPGKQLAEKHISGDYLGLLLKVVASELEKSGLLTQKIMHDKSEFFSRLLKVALDKNIAYEYLNPYMVATLMYLARQAIVRSAQLAGTMIGTGIATFKNDYFPNWNENRKRDYKMDYILEGSIVEKVPGYLSLVNQYANEVSEQWRIKINVRSVENAGIFGAAAAALDIYRRNTDLTGMI
ncbi:hypothetical protein A2W14_05120 [Candidatus Gottesmanbacteria bacterium RBG_16_37_8]|uniref:Hexokinase n=1 Tax=Candidatus Gottesmanbacteria bacterium RBG_16_37_8 TaxID=1798371 RepID=A0A1F5YR41_9BACT|nr:MAG: hypothetical protein A2W14_05120 [Candidatus Gottesmanbacteria bacterium RBG_16_37_8]